MSIDDVMAEQGAKFDRLLSDTRARIRAAVPPKRDPHYNAARDPYRLYADLRPIEGIYAGGMGSWF